MRSAKRKGFKSFLKRLFRRRSVIVMSDQSVDHYPVNGGVQLLLLVGVIGIFSWVSYSTGSYMAAHHVLQEKDRQLFSTALQTKKIGEEYKLLKHDLKKLTTHKGDLSEYAKFVLEQHSKKDNPALNEGTVIAENKLGEMKSRLLERITFLEERLYQLDQENQAIVTTVMERTQDKIKELREIIDQTGLNTSRMVDKAKTEIASAQDGNGLYANQGGPYLPDTVQDLAPDMMEKIDEVLALQHVIERLPLAKPLLGARMSSRFGRRYDPFTHRPAMHSGLDFVGKANERVVATADGVVKYADRKGAYGNLVILDHGYGVTTRYAHLSKVSVAEGQRVKKGERIGNQGTTGRSTGQHLHYEVRYNKRPINPMNFIKAGSYVR